MSAGGRRFRTVGRQAESGVVALVAFLVFLCFVLAAAAGVFAVSLFRLRAELSPGSAREFLGLEELRYGLARFRGGRYVAVAEVPASVNYLLMSGPEQDRVEAAFGALLNSLSFPVQFYTQSRAPDLGDWLSQLADRVRSLDDPLRDYGQLVLSHLSEWAGRRGVMVRRNFVVVPVWASSFEEAEREVSRRLEVIAQGLRRIGRLELRRLSTTELGELLYVALNKERALAPKFSDMVREGLHTLFATRRGREDAPSVFAKKGAA